MITRKRDDESGTTTIVTVSFTTPFLIDVFIWYRFRINPLILNEPSTNLHPPHSTLPTFAPRPAARK